jgi:hypothetical protein
MKKTTLLVGIAVLAVACAPGPRDYMDEQLRSQVEALKVAATLEPTSMENLAERLDVLWQWANAYAVSGGALPVHVPFAAGILGESVTDGTEPDPWILSEFDKFIEELAVKDGKPDVMGTIEFESTMPVVVGSWQTFEQTWTVGSMPMQPGGAVLLGRQLQANQGLYQFDNPEADHYVSIRSSNSDAVFEKTTVPLRGLHGGFRASAEMPAFRLQGTTLEPGDTLTVTIGDTSGGSRGLRIQTDSTDRLMFPLYLDLEGNGNFFTPVWPGVEVIGAEVLSVRGVAPSVVTPGESFELALRSEDRYFNRASGRIPAYAVLLDGQPFARIEAGTEAIAVLEDLAIDEPGVYRFTITTEDGSIIGQSNPVWVREDPPHRIFWGETHGHTDFAEGQGSPEQYFTYGRDDARLDFFTLSEHDIMMDDGEWKTLQELVTTHTEEGRLITYLGYEWTVERDRGGHHNVLFRTPDRHRVGVQRANRLPELYRILAEENQPEDVIIIPHAHQAGDWNLNDPELEKVVEIYSMHGSFEWFGNFYLRSGFEIGFIAASDDHRAKGGYAQGRSRAPLAQFGGLAAVMAPAKTVDGIFDAIRGLSAYATSGQRIILAADLNGSRMGTRLENAAERQITCNVMGTSPIDHIDVIKNGEVVFSRHYITAPLESNARVLVGFESSSEVFGEVRDNPRGYRIWEGTLKVNGAKVINVSAPGFENVYTDRVERIPDDPNLIRFRTETRGRSDTMLVELEGASAATTFSVHLEPTTEYGAAPTLVRPPADLPAADLRLRLSRLVDGRLEHEFEVAEHTDRITLQVVDPDGALDQEFSYTDLGPTAPGDYYYVRVTQLDGGRAWSSPFWVDEKGEE